MEDHEIAAFLRDQCRRRMSGAGIALAENIADRHEVSAADLRQFEHLKTQFAADLARAGKSASR